MIERAGLDARGGETAGQEPDASAARAQKRVLVLASTFPRWQGDTEPPFVLNLCRSLQDDFEITVLAPHAAGALSAEKMDRMQVVRFAYFWPQGMQKLAYGGILPNLKRNPLLWVQVPFFLTAELFAAWRLARSRRIDVVHAHWVVPQGLIAAAVGILTQTPVVITAHGGDVYGVRGFIQDALKRWALRHSAAVTAVSTDLADAMAGLLGGAKPPPAHVISMGIDTDRFCPEGRDDHLKAELGIDGPFLLFVGRLAEKKGVRYLIEALPAVLARFPSAKLVIVGDGPLRGELEALSQRLSLDERVAFAGAKRPEELPPYYATADVFIGPSVVAAGGDSESFGLVFAEAMASGCPVVASDVGGVRELVEDGKTGLLVPQRQPTAIAQAVCRLLADEALRRRLSARALEMVRRRFDQRSIADRYALVLQDAAA